MQSSSLKKAIWFTGSIEEAVKAVTENNLILLVYIFDESEKSKKFNIVFEDGNLVSAIESKAIALKLQKDSHEANLFGQLYPINHVPLVYFILQGTIKDFGIEGLSSQDIISKINNLSPPTTTKDIKEKLKEIKEKHIEKEEKQLKEREMKRREEGKIAQETLQDLKEKQEKTYFEKLKKERKAEEEYKKKIKEQIAKDRADQIAARKAEKQRISIEKEKNMNHNTSSDYYSHCNLNIKQLNGSNLRHSFSPSNRLSEVIEWIDINRTDSDVPYRLFAQFPNRNFDIGEEQRTLLELKLCPSATLIMKPMRNVSTAYNRERGSWIDYLYSAGNTIYNSVSSITSYLATPTTTTTTTTTATVPESGQRSNGESSNPSQQSITTNTLTNKKNDDDINQRRHIYNGNSVNQE